MAAVMLLAGTASHPARAAEPVARPAATAADSAAVDSLTDEAIDETEPDTTIDDVALRRERLRRATAAAAAKKPSRFSTPRWVMLRSLVVPGWGQAYNGAWIKAGLVAAGEVVLVSQVVNDHKALDRLTADVHRARQLGDVELENVAIEAYNQRLDSATTRQYLLGAVMVYSLLDAYVDAHFRHFKIEFESDPALPGGTKGGGARIGWEFRY